MAVVATMNWKTYGLLKILKWTFLIVCTLGIYPVYKIVKYFMNKKGTKEGSTTEAKTAN